MESFFALLQKNVLGRCRWNSRHQMRLAIITSIERTYHRRKRQKRLGILTRNPDAPLAVRGTHRLA